MSSIYKFSPTISISGDMSASPSLGSHTFTSLDVADYQTMVIKNTGTKAKLDLGNADYYSAIYLQTDNPISVYVNSSVNTAIPCESFMALTGGSSDITEVWVRNTGTSLATLKIAYGGKLTA